MVLLGNSVGPFNMTLGSMEHLAETPVYYGLIFAASLHSAIVSTL